MLLKQIGYFVNIIEKNSFTLAAEECFISQSAISQQIQVLENELGVKLLVRQNRKFTVTSAGEHFYRYGKDILQRVEKLKAETKRLGEQDDIVLNIGYPRMYIGEEVKEAIEEFTRIYPEAIVNIEKGNHEELYFKLRDKKLDIVVNDQRRVFSDRFENVVLSEVGCYAEIASSLYGETGLHLNIEELNIPCILTASEAQRNIERDYYTNTLNFSDNYIFTETTEEARLLAIAKRGFMLAEGTNRQTSENLRRLPLYYEGRPVMRNYCIFWLKERSNYYLEEFANILKGKF